MRLASRSAQAVHSRGGVGRLAVCTHVSSRRGRMVVGSRCRSSWIMASTSCLVTRTVKHADRVAFRDAHDLADEVGGESLTNEQSMAEEERQGRAISLPVATSRTGVFGLVQD